MPWPKLMMVTPNHQSTIYVQQFAAKKAQTGLKTLLTFRSFEKLLLVPKDSDFRV